MRLPPIRNYQPGDEKSWLALIRACPDFDEHFFNRSPSLDALRVVVEHPHMDAGRSLFFADCGTGFAGYAEIWCMAGQPRAAGRVAAWDVRCCSLACNGWRSRK
jgi:hypothetical protein